MKEQYERALKALADKMEQLRDTQDKPSPYHNCNSMLNVAKAMEKIGRILVALEHIERMDNDVKDTVEMWLQDMARKDET